MSDGRRSDLRMLPGSQTTRIEKKRQQGSAAGHGGARLSDVCEDLVEEHRLVRRGKSVPVGSAREPSEG